MAREEALRDGPDVRRGRLTGPHPLRGGTVAFVGALDAVEFARKRNGFRDTRPTIAHIDLSDPADWPRLRKLGVIASMSTQWAQRDSFFLDASRPYFGDERWLRQRLAGRPGSRRSSPCSRPGRGPPRRRRSSSCRGPAQRRPARATARGSPRGRPAPPWSRATSGPCCVPGLISTPRLRATRCMNLNSASPAAAPDSLGGGFGRNRSSARARVNAVDGVDVTLARNEIVGLIGPNGARKTTLVNRISGVSKPHGRHDPSAPPGANGPACSEPAS